MHLRTHFAVGLVVALYFLPHIVNKLVFFPTVLVASILPNITSILSYRVKNYSKRRNFFSLLGDGDYSRGIIHTYTFCIAVSVLLAFFYPVFALPFFLGYSFHLYLDAFTPKGITPFWPYKKKSTGHVKTGGKIDKLIFYIVCVFCAALLINLFL